MLVPFFCILMDLVQVTIAAKPPLAPNSRESYSIPSGFKLPYSWISIEETHREFSLGIRRHGEQHGKIEGSCRRFTALNHLLGLIRFLNPQLVELLLNAAQQMTQSRQYIETTACKPFSGQRLIANLI